MIPFSSFPLPPSYIEREPVLVLFADTIRMNFNLHFTVRILLNE